MDWFLYDNGLRHERVKFKLFAVSFEFFENVITSQKKTLQQLG